MRWLTSALALTLVACGSDTPPPAPVESTTASAPAEADTTCPDFETSPLLHVPSPDWRKQVVYMLFIDRFDDGDPDNNDTGAGEYDPTSPAHFNGGDLQGVIDRLDYLQSLGVTTVWISPPVENQLWSTPYAAAGWHGYWAVDFKKVDPHFGDLETYQRLSHELHCRGMYLIQDIVANHVGNFYAWNGPYDPENRAENFYLLEEDTAYRDRPTQPPFDQVDIRDPEQAAADIYHWAPEIDDFDDPEKQFTWSLGLLSDINTTNPVVIEAFKETYRYWIEAVGVDGYRIDTVIYVDHPFWHRFLHDDNGIMAAARGTGRDHFLQFGEVLVASEPFQTDGEKRITAYFGTPERPELNSMLGFPLYYTIGRVLAQGQPAAQLAFRIEQHMTQYPDPQVTPTFIDNHDTMRFLGSGSQAAFRQALALIYALPGIPILYQGTEQALQEPRQAMFEGGWGAEPGIFDESSSHFRWLQELAALRASGPIWTEGDLTVLFGEEAGPGLVAFRRDLGTESALVVLNSANHGVLVDGLAAAGTWSRSFGDGAPDALTSKADGTLTFALEARAFAIFSPTPPAADVGQSTPRAALAIETPIPTEAIGEDFILSGTVEPGITALRLLRNGNLDDALDFAVAGDGRWEVEVPVRDLGTAREFLQVYEPVSGALSPRWPFEATVIDAAMAGSAEDAPDDAFGPTGDYLSPQQPASGSQREILGARWRASGRNLELRLTMAEVTNVWKPPNGFDNLLLSTFFAVPGQDSVRALPLMNADMPGEAGWSLAHVGYGWGSYTFAAGGATAARQGDRLGVSPTVAADKAAREITLVFERAKLGVDDWEGVEVYVTTWSHNGEGGYSLIEPEPSNWNFGGAPPDASRLMDTLQFRISAN